MKNLIIQLLIFVVAAGSLVPSAVSQTRSSRTKRGLAVKSTALPDGVSSKDVTFYSEGVQCYGKVFMPAGFNADSKAPAVIVAPGWGELASSVEPIAAGFASAGLVAMAIDY